MHYPVFFFVFLAFLSGNPAAKKQAENKPLTDSVKCQNTRMPRAWYSYGADNTLTPLTDQRKDFIIAVNKNCKATNFISDIEKYSHNNSEHVRNNNGKHVIRIMNNTTDTVFLQTQDGSFMAVMQGLTKSGQWCCLEYWQFSTCGNSYHNIGFLPNAKGAFVAQLPNNGNYETKFRFKLMGKDRYYYSDEFTGKIDYCAFTDSALARYNTGDTIINRGSYRYTEYKK